MDNLRDVSEACSQLIKCRCKQTCDVNVSEMIKIALTYAHVKEDVHGNIYIECPNLWISSFGYILNMCILFSSVVLTYTDNKILSKFVLNVEI